MAGFQKISKLRKSTVFKSIGTYTFTNFFTKGTSFLLIFIYTNPVYITPSENGLLSLFSNGLTFLMPFLAMGIIHSTGTDYFKLNRNEFKDFFTTGFVPPLIVLLLSTIVLFFFRERLYENYGLPYFFFWLIPVVTFFNFCNEQMLNIARSTNKPKLFMKVNMFKGTVEMCLSVLLVVVFAWRWEGRLAGIFVAFGVTTLWAIYYFYKQGFLFGKVRSIYLRNELIYAVPVITMQASIYCVNASDKFFLAKFTNDNNETVGIYSIAFIFASVLLMLCNGMLQYFFPKIYANLSSGKPHYGLIRKQFFLFAALMAAGTIVVMAIIPLCYNWGINEMYHSALDYYYYFCIGFFFWSVNYFFYSFLLYYKMKRKLLALSLISIAISLIVYYFAIRYYGAEGAAKAHCLIHALLIGVTLAFTAPFWKKIFFNQPPRQQPDRSAV
jgi:O-antigen/teichoic acid export membrane protein